MINLKSHEIKVTSLFRPEKTIGLFNARVALGTKAFFPGGAAGFRGTPSPWKPGGVHDDAFHAGVGHFQVGVLGAFFIGGDNELPFACNAAGQGLTNPHCLGIVKAANFIKAHTQGYLGIYLVDVLAAGPA